MAFASAAGGTTNPWKNIPGNNAITGGGLAVPSNGYGAFNRSTANNAQNYLSGKALPDVWGGANARFQGLTDKIGNQLFAGGSPWSGGGIWGGQFRPGPDSPLLKGYQENLMGGARNLSNDFVNQAAYAGPNRAGTGVVGGADPRSAMAYNATKALAGNYGDTYKSAYDMASRDWTNMANLWGQGLGAYSNLANTELGALRGASDYNLGQGNIGAQLNAQNLQGVGQEAQLNKDYWQNITDWQRGEPGRQQQKNLWNQQNADWLSGRQAATARDNQINTLESVVKGINSTQPGAGWLNVADRMHLSDLLASLEKVGPYGGVRGGSKQTQWKGQPGFDAG